MSDTCFYSVPPGANDILRTALEAAALPTAGIDGPDLLLFGLSDEAGLIGYIGLEGAGPDRLLRSMVVLPSRRRQGFGRTLAEHLETTARGEVARFHLLTTTAARFFRGLGYQDADRATAPSAIAATAEFTTLCPASATYMVKSLSIA